MNIQTEFRRIRDIPYRIPLSPSESDHCCSGKMKMLKAWCDANGVPSRYRVCAFRWSDLTLPPEVASVPHADDSTHVYLEVSLGGNWIDLDPTWDAELSEVLPVNAWGDRSDTRIAVPPFSLFSHEESARIMEWSFDEDDFRVNGAFYRAFNGWLESCHMASVR